MPFTNALLAAADFGPATKLPAPEILAAAIVLLLVLLIFGTRRA